MSLADGSLAVQGLSAGGRGSSRIGPAISSCRSKLPAEWLRRQWQFQAGQLRGPTLRTGWHGLADRLPFAFIADLVHRYRLHRVGPRGFMVGLPVGPLWKAKVRSERLTNKSIAGGNVRNAQDRTTCGTTCA